MKKVFGLLGILLLMVMGACANTAEEPKKEISNSEQAAENKETAEETKATVALTKNNMEEEVDSKEVAIKEGQTLMDVMKENFEVEEAGGFINGIDGIKASESEKTYWHLVVNGEDAMTGANEIELKDGDKIEFDLRNYE